MTEAKHTPGPWHWVDRGHYYRLETLDGYEIADDGSSCGEYGGWMYSPDEPNARLIAAAPELLEALQEAIDCGMVPSSSCSDGGASKYSRQVQVADMIRAAVAKATGN